MDWITLLNQIVVVFGVPALLGAAIVIGRKFEILDRLERTVDMELVPDIQDLRIRFSVLENKFSSLETKLSRTI